MTDDDNKSPSLLDVTKSVLWAMIGVQKSENHERDFKYGKAWQYIIVGLIGVAIFITILITVVQFAMSMAGV